jgi:hypothetical protein
MSKRHLFFALFSLASMGQVWVAHGQQSLFNVPSVVATQAKNIFFQEQINLSTQGLTFNFTGAYGLGKGWEVGLNGYGINAGLQNGSPTLMLNRTDASQPFAPLVLATVLKQFSPSQHWRLGIGSQNGLCPYDNAENKHFATFSYASACYMPWHEYEFHAGAYFGNNVLLGGKTQPGLMAGYELPITKRLHAMGDGIFGTSSAAVAVLGGVYYVNTHTSLSLGWQVGSPGTNNPRGVVFELTVK